MKRTLLALVAVVMTGCATIPDGCYTDAYNGTKNCYTNGELTELTPLTTEEHLEAVQREKLRLQYEMIQSQNMMNMINQWQKANPPQPQPQHMYIWGF